MAERSKFVAENFSGQQPRELVALKSYESQPAKCKLLHRRFVLR